MPHLSFAGDLDLVVGYGDPQGSVDAGITYYENTGESTAPKFEDQTDLFKYVDFDNFIYPALGDLNGDGALRRPSHASTATTVRLFFRRRP